MASIFSELKRRNVFKVGVAYAIVAWLLVQVADVVLPTFGAPEWVMQVFTLFVVLGFPLALIVAWAYDLTPEGIKAAADVQPTDTVPHPAGEKLNYAVLGFIALAVGFLVVDRFFLAPGSLRGESNTAANLQANPSSTVVRRAFIPLGRTQPFQGGQLDTMIALSPDGRRLAYAARVGDTPQLYVRELDQVTARILPGTDGAYLPFFSPDGEWLGFFRDGALQKISVRGGLAQTLVENTRGAPGGLWTADDSIIYTATSPETGWRLHRVAATGSTPELLKVEYDPWDMTHGWPDVLPGGNHLLFTTRRVGGIAIDGSVELLSMETGESRTLLEGAYNARYSPSGHIVFGRSAALWAVPFDLERMETTGPEVPVINSVQTAGNRGAAVYAFSDDGLLIYLPGSFTNDTSAIVTLIWVDRDGREKAVDTGVSEYRWPRISPDSQRLAYYATDSNGDEDVWILDLTRGTKTRLTFDSGYSPLWTPDGQRVVFYSNRQGPESGLYWKRADGSGQEELLLSGGIYLPVSFSPDGNQLIVRKGGLGIGESRELHLLSLAEKTTSRPLLENRGNPSFPAISPDGRWLAYTSDDSGQSEVYVQPFPKLEDGKWQVSSDGGRQPRWGPDGREIFYHNTDAMMVVSVEDEPGFLAGRPEVLFSGEYLFSGPVRSPAYDISPDGQRFLMQKKVAGENDEIDEQTMLIVVENWFEELKRLAPADAP